MIHDWWNDPLDIWRYGEMGLPILCLDFDGVLHSYTSGWKGANVIPDPPVPGAVDFIEAVQSKFEIYIYSSRSHQPGGIDAMKEWLFKSICEERDIDSEDAFYNLVFTFVNSLIKWPTEKPPAMITIDDRAICFTGEWPDLEELLNFKPWNKK